MGTKLFQAYQMLADCHVAFYKINSSTASIIQTLASGWPVLVSASETGMHDINNGGKVDYSWTPAGNHTIVVTGVDVNNNLLVRDYANIASNGPRGPQPMTYDAAKFGPIEWAVSIVPFWEMTQQPGTGKLTLTPQQIQAFQALLPTFQ